MPRSCYAGIFPGLAALALALLTGCGEPAEPLAAPARGDALPGADAGRGRERIAEYGCVSCHAIPGVRGPGARVGPPLRHLASRAYLAGVLPNTPANLVRWLRDPPAIAPRTAMPDMGLSEADARDIAAYLLTLH
ncbi:c-type cytochrome [Bordetella petrii]|uniref:Cytochrome c n=1 Tax=Bordetella petrii (strain ATCC BAA-461 / DSM 12804 / CCUG 43448 / CIP 107267 / Se-1111R) TaxID=340100 RepID=A9IUK4_BORPD|nr:c-type cytochrome [Bordetella petrii]CAP43555.1 putative cytochrome c [Bordetella petrii]